MKEQEMPFIFTRFRIPHAVLKYNGLVKFRRRIAMRVEIRVEKKNSKQK